MTRLQSFIARWSSLGGSELAKSRLFLSEFCDALGLVWPEPAKPANENSACSCERRVFVRENDRDRELKRPDLYFKGHFVLEAKQGRDVAALLPSQTGSTVPVRGTRHWEDMMRRGWRQAERFVRRLPHYEGRPPFVIVADVGYCFDLYSEFSSTGGSYLHFPDPRSHRIMLADLKKLDVQDRFRAIWSDPMSMDPSRRAAEVTEEVAGYLSTLARSLEADGHDPTSVSQFLMRCVFSMFADSAGIIPSGCFATIVRKCIDNPKACDGFWGDLWKAVDFGYVSATAGCALLPFDGNLFTDPQILPLKREHMSVMLQAALADWKEVEPAIFGTLLERALDPKERHRLGAHYTPRAYVERLVIPTIMQPLRREWDDVQSAANMLFQNNRKDDACNTIRKYHDRLCRVRVLDPACGSGNFLYVTMEHMKRLESEVIQALASYGGKQTSHLQVDPHQFLGLEINPRAASIAQLVLWIGYLRWHLRTYEDAEPPEPVIRKFNSIQCRDALIAYTGRKLSTDENGKPIERWNGETYKKDPVTGRQVPDVNATTVDIVYEGVTVAEWPRADFIVGNPPFVGSRNMRVILGSGYVDAVRSQYKCVSGSCDYVMYWWHRAAELLRERKTKRFGFITTNSIGQISSRRVVARHLEGSNSLRLAFVIPDHPWVEASDGAAVRVAMTVADMGNADGILARVVGEHETGQRGRSVELLETAGRIHSNMRIGANTTSVVPLIANSELSSAGVKLHGAGFVVSLEQAITLGLTRRNCLDRHIRPYINGKDVVGIQRGAMVIDMYGLSAEQVLDRYPEVYRWLDTHVKPEREQNTREEFRSSWWLFGAQRATLRAALVGLGRYIVTVFASKHRCFSFFPENVLPDGTLIVVASNDAYHLGVLTSRIHVSWSLAMGGTLEDRPLYNNSLCFATFPFPDASVRQQTIIRELCEKLDKYRKQQQNLHPKLTLTGMYNALDALRSGRYLAFKDKHVHLTGIVNVLSSLHDDLDAAVADAYGWPVGLSDEEILSRLVALNAERSEEERNGLIRWLRPEFQTKSREERKAPHV